MTENPLRQLHTFGQSIWLDFIRRSILSSGELSKMIAEDGLCGVTSNPSIFEKAIAGSHDYDAAIRALALEGHNVQDIYQALTVEDVQHAADLFRPLYDETDGRDGLVSLEVSPHLAHNTQGTLVEARRLWAALDRPNVMIKVPGTREGLAAIRQLISEGVNVNVTLLFGLPRYREVAEAYIAGLEDRAAQGKPIDRVASVASFFLSRIDVLVDRLLEKKMAVRGATEELARRLHGQVAIASAKVAYQMYKKIYAESRFQTLVVQGARPQRLLWASTSTKNPAYSDIKYVEALIGPETVNTVPLETLNAYRDHGHPASRLETDLPEAHAVLQGLSALRFDLDQITQQLEDEGVQKFNQPFDRLMETLGKARAAALAEPLDRQIFTLGTYQTTLQQRMTALEQEQFSARLWRKDPTLWKSDQPAQAIIRNALGWLHVAEKMEDTLPMLLDFVQGVRAANFRHVLYMGMGGSSLAPLVFQRTFSSGKEDLPLTVLDTTDPATILQIERQIPLAETLYIVASKSGTTAESLALGEYFYQKLKEWKGEKAGENFVAITDPDTPLIKLAQESGFRSIFCNFPDIGGRYSALSYFGLTPAALMGVDVAELLERSLRMMHACTSCVPVAENPGVTLGAVMGELARQGRDKVTFLLPSSLAPLGMWLEQLLAESTGKEGTGLLPVVGEPLGDPSVYGTDRLFVYIRPREEDEASEWDMAILHEAGHPVVTIQMDSLLDLGQEFFRWEIATATAGALLGINAFDQPNVQESKDNTNHLLEIIRKQGQLPAEKPAVVKGTLHFYAPKPAHSAQKLLKTFLAQAKPGDYVALQAYLPETPEIQRTLQTIRLHLRDRLRLATTLGYGPRFLHSTGQFHKGGPNTGLFLQLTADDAEDIAVPGQPYTFGVFKRVQALGDLEALRKHGRRVVHVHLGKDVVSGLQQLAEVLP